MIDVIFKKNYFEELPDDIKDKILKKAKDMKEWDIINKGTNNLYNKLKKIPYQGDWVFYLTSREIECNYSILKSIPFSIKNIDLIFDNFKKYYLLSYFIANNTHEDRYKLYNTIEIYDMFNYYILDYYKCKKEYIKEIKYRYDEVVNKLYNCTNGIYGKKRWNKQVDMYKKYYDKNIKCNKQDYNKIKLIFDYLYDIDKILIDKNYGIYEKEDYEKIIKLITEKDGNYTNYGFYESLFKDICDDTEINEFYFNI